MDAVRVVFTLPPFQVVGTAPADPLAAWESIKNKTLEDLYAPQLDKIRVTVVVETSLAVPDKGEQNDETVNVNTDAGN